MYKKFHNNKNKTEKTSTIEITLSFAYLTCNESCESVHENMTVHIKKKDSLTSSRKTLKL